MKETDAREELYVLIDKMPKKNIDKAKELLEILIEHNAEDLIIIEPLDEKRLTPLCKRKLKQSREEIKRGEVYSLGEVAKELGYGS